MPEAQDEDGRGSDLIAQLGIADDDPADLARLIGFQLLADPRILKQTIRRVGELRTGRSDAVPILNSPPGAFLLR